MERGFFAYRSIVYVAGVAIIACDVALHLTREAMVLGFGGIFAGALGWAAVLTTPQSDEQSVSPLAFLAALLAFGFGCWIVGVRSAELLGFDWAQGMIDCRRPSTLRCSIDAT